MLATTPPPVKLQPPLLQGPWTTRGDCASGHAPGAPVAIHPAPCWAEGDTVDTRGLARNGRQYLKNPFPERQCLCWLLPSVLT